MNCDNCKQPMNYAFYINDAHWIKVVGEERFDNNVGHVCAHCTLERLGGGGWYITWNEPVEKIRVTTSTDDLCPSTVSQTEETSHATTNYH